MADRIPASLIDETVDEVMSELRERYGSLGYPFFNLIATATRTEALKHRSKKENTNG